jgi:hypothetical protein
MTVEAKLFFIVLKHWLVIRRMGLMAYKTLPSTNRLMLICLLHLFAVVTRETEIGFCLILGNIFGLTAVGIVTCYTITAFYR